MIKYCGELLTGLWYTGGRKMDEWLKTRKPPSHLISAAGLVVRDGRILLIENSRRGWER